VYLIFHNFQCFLPYSRSYQLIFSISELVSFLAIFQVLQFESVIFLVGQFSRHITTVCIYHFYFFSVSHHIPGPTFCVSHFPRFSVFSPYPSSYSRHFSFSRFFTGFCHIPGQTVFVYHFQRFSVFSPYSRSYYVYISFFVLFCLSLHIPGYTVCVSHFPRF
jgi:hypothetical protein